MNRVWIGEPRPSVECEICWGTHGCTKKQDHRFGHRCTCCRWPLLLHILFHECTGKGCVGQWPYYGGGSKTNFYSRYIRRNE